MSMEQVDTSALQGRSFFYISFDASFTGRYA